MEKLLLVDDDKDILMINKQYLTREGYEVRAVLNASSALSILKTYPADCIVLDVLMPGMNGFKLCEKIKDLTKAPFIFLTGCSTEDEKIRGLLLGANDYILKPYSMRELSARIKVQIRRYKGEQSSSTVLSLLPLKLDLVAHKAFYNEDEILLSNREYELLYLLASHPNETITFAQIGQYMWGSYTDTDRRTIMVTASRLRKKFESYVGLNELIETVWSKGYLLKLKH